MNKLRVFFQLLITLALISANISQAADKPEDAVAMVEKGLAYLQKNGKDALVREINAKNPDFIVGELYLYIRGIDGTVLAHPVNPKLVGKNLIELPDAEGKLFRKDIVELAKSKGKGWVDYRYNNPVSKQIESKSTYLQRAGDIILEAGIYKGK
ncbi:cache domain-containing protein [Undibacterium rugosum]|uniref:Cache domain-containing protein n=1 Tax=Undibacterium rugosum TaxID=2762291 RepID=A0A923I2H8_9BURK|nr:cache domain-containing protein [Undibacterium rugosum]MBC3936584.1 cache domain-containing protein [Undibacterium rugosum]MBR7779840.1 cache domain-containing protein [Undibacterium rugosum]